MLCFRSTMLVRSFTVNKISGTRRVINHFCIRYAIFLCSFEYCHLLELYVKCAALYRTLIPQSFWNTRCGRPRGIKFNLTRWLRLRDGRRSGTIQTENTVRHTKYGRIRGMVVDEGGRSTGFYCIDLIYYHCSGGVSGYFLGIIR